MIKRSSTDKLLLGVCAGIGEHLGIDPLFIRIGTIVAILSTGVVPGLIVYTIAGILMR